MPPKARAAEPEINPKDRIVITHPDTDGEAVATRRQFEVVWQPKGWTEVKVDPDDLEARVDAVATGIGGTPSTVDAAVVEA